MLLTHTYTCTYACCEFCSDIFKVSALKTFLFVCFCRLCCCPHITVIIISPTRSFNKQMRHDKQIRAISPTQELKLSYSRLSSGLLPATVLFVICRDKTAHLLPLMSALISRDLPPYFLPVTTNMFQPCVQLNEKAPSKASAINYDNSDVLLHGEVGATPRA